MDTLPNEILEMIFKNLDVHDLCRVSMVCKRWRNIGVNQQLWKTLCLKNGLKEEPNLSELCGDYVKTCGVWKAYYRLYSERCINWKNNKYTEYQSEGSNWFYPGWSSFQDICVLPSSNAVGVFKITCGAIRLEQVIKIPLPESDCTWVHADIRLIAVAKRNMIVIYSKTENGYKFKTMYACQDGTVVKLTGDPENEENISSFIGTNYDENGHAEVIEIEANYIWIHDFENKLLFVIQEDRYDIVKCFSIKGLRIIKTGSGYVCFLFNKSLCLCNVDGEVLYEVSNAIIGPISFTDKYIGVIFDSDTVEIWNIKKKESLTTLEATSGTTLTINDDFIFILQFQISVLSCHDIHDGTVRWRIGYIVPGIVSIPDYSCKLSVILNKFLYVYTKESKEYAVLDIHTGCIFYKSKCYGWLHEITDRFIVTLTLRINGGKGGPQLYIRSYM